MTVDRPLAPSVSDFIGADVDPGRVSAFARLAGAVSDLQNGFAYAGMDAATMDSLTERISALADELAAREVAETERLYGRGMTLPSRGQTWVPPFVPRSYDGTSCAGTVTFQPYHCAAVGAIHGGAVMAVLDEAFGWMIGQDDRPRSRTAYLKVNFRALTPVSVPLTVDLRIDEHVGRKLFVSGEMRNGNIVCADAEGLFLHLYAGQT